MSTSMPGGAKEWIFISYRRSDSGGHAQSVYLELKSRYDAEGVFFDTDKIDIGVDFPSRLTQAVQAAWLLIVVIGPDWLKTLNTRAAGLKVDYVREELKLGLARRQHGEELTMLTVLVGGAGAPDRHDLAETLRAELGNLAAVNAHVLRPVPGWHEDFKLLFDKIAPIHAALPEVYAAQHQVTERLRKAVAAILARPEMAAIRVAWGADPLCDHGPTEAHDLLVGLFKAIKAAQAAWAQPGAALAASQVPLVKDACCELVALLYRLAVDIAAVRIWQAGGRPAPVEQPGTAAVVAAVAQDAQIWASLRSRGSTFHAARTIDFDDGLDAGIGDDRLEQAFRDFWALAFETEAPASPSGLRDADLRKLRNRMTTLAKSDSPPFGVTAIVSTDDQHASLRRLADRLAVRAYGRTGEMNGPLLSVDEGLLADALCLCLEHVGKIQ